ncbi:MAG: hypothetical protein WB995_09555 [Candidatus Acidiferrales bacterium]
MNFLKTTILTFALAIAMTILATPAHAQHCSAARLAGNWGFTLNGVVVLPTGPVPIAAVGTAKLDGQGNVTGTEARSVGGQYADETLTGTFSVNSDCTGTTTINFYEDGQLARTSVLSFVVDNSNTEIRFVQKSLTLPDGTVLPVILTTEMKRMLLQ